MTISEWLKTGKRRCKCDDVKFIVEKVKVKIAKRKSNDEITNLIRNVLEGTEHKEINRYTARCSKCNKLYLADSSKKGLNESIVESGVFKV